MSKNRNKKSVGSMIAMAILLLVVEGMMAQNSFAQAEMGTRQTRKNDLEESAIERAFMGGSEIQGSIEKPHVIYIVPWKEGDKPSKREIHFDRSFKAEILEPLDYGRFHKKWGQKQGGETSRKGDR